MRFRDFYLNERDREVELDRRNTRLDIEKIAEYIESHCSDSWWMVEKNRPLLRRSGKNFGSVTVVDPVQGYRPSYTNRGMTLLNEVLADQQPHLPRRYHSVFASFEDPPESYYGSHRYAVIPHNGAKIARCDRDDFLSTEYSPITRGIKTFAVAETIHYDSLVHTHEEIVPWAKNTPATEFVEANLKYLGLPTNEGESVYDFLMRTFHPNVEKITTKNLQALSDGNYRGVEIWTEGPVLLIEINTWGEFRREILKRGAV